MLYLLFYDRSVRNEGSIYLHHGEKSLARKFVHAGFNASVDGHISS